MFVNNQHDAQFFSLYLFIPILYMFQATKWSSSGESIVSIWPMVDAELLARSQYSEGPAIGHLDTGFPWFPCA